MVTLVSRVRERRMADFQTLQIAKTEQAAAAICPETVEYAESCLERQTNTVTSTELHILGNISNSQI